MRIEETAKKRGREGQFQELEWESHPKEKRRRSGRWQTQESLCACRGELEGNIRSMGCSKKENVDQQQSSEYRGGLHAMCSSFVGVFHGRLEKPR